MRVVGGVAGGRRLRAPAGRSIRPTGDRVREAVFNVLTSLRAVEGATVVDLFAGTGALGIEALSRGAAHVTFVDRDPAAAATIRDNVAAVGLAGASSEVVRGRRPGLASARAGPGGRPVGQAIRPSTWPCATRRTTSPLGSAS